MASAGGLGLFRDFGGSMRDFKSTTQARAAGSTRDFDRIAAPARAAVRDFEDRIAAPARAEGQIAAPARAAAGQTALTEAAGRVVLLYTSSPLDQRTNGVRFIVTLLHNKGVTPLLVDGGAPEHLALREALWERSGRRGSYPQLFFDGTPVATDALQRLVDDGSLDAMLAPFVGRASNQLGEAEEQPDQPRESRQAAIAGAIDAKMAAKMAALSAPAPTPGDSEALITEAPAVEAAGLCGAGLANAAGAMEAAEGAPPDASASSSAAPTDPAAPPAAIPSDAARESTAAAARSSPSVEAPAEPSPAPARVAAELSRLRAALLVSEHALAMEEERAQRQAEVGIYIHMLVYIGICRRM